MKSDAHDPSSGRAPEPLYDITVRTPTHAELARTLVSRITTGTLCTLAVEPEGFPVRFVRDLGERALERVSGLRFA